MPHARAVAPTVLFLVFAGAPLAAQQSSAPLATIQQLFTAMAAGDSAAARRAFLPVGRVLPIRGTPPTPLTVDQFAAYVATIPPGSWNERIWEPRSETFESLAQVWFEYDVVRADTVSQCGRQSVQLTRTPDGWRIMSMAFTSAPSPCTRAPR